MSATKSNNSAAREAGQKLPNYRIYDRTGGGVTKDIYAETLEEAIEQGRRWIEGGDWSGIGGEDSGEGKRYAASVTLECCVREIVYVPDVSSVLSIPGVIDEEATDDGQEYDCSGSYSDTLPDCPMREHGDGDDDGHIYRAPYSIVGGCKENPGVWIGSGTRMTTMYVCSLCGCVQHNHYTGSQRNPDDYDTITITDLTDSDEEDKIREWMIETHEEDGFIPMWLAEYLDVLPTTRMTLEQAEEYVRYHRDSDDLDYDDLEHAFAAIFGRRADDYDRQPGLWSHLCAAVEEEAR